MANYAEELAYWYLRLNGFFILENFVIQRSPTNGDEIKYRSDADILAVRFPNAIEIIEGKELKCDDKALFSKDGFDKNNILGLIVEVKSADHFEGLNIFEDPSRMKYALRRIGFLGDKDIDGLIGKEWKRMDINENYQIGKLLIHNAGSVKEEYEKIAFALRLFDVKQFIRTRFKENKAEKWASRMFFPSSLMQFLISEASHSGDT